MVIGATLATLKLCFFKNIFETFNTSFYIKNKFSILCYYHYVKFYIKILPKICHLKKLKLYFLCFYYLIIVLKNWLHNINVFLCIFYSLD
jgi:hypothetical protein